MTFETSMWEVSRPPFKPRYVADPQNNIFTRQLGNTAHGVGHNGAGAAKAKLARIVNGAPEVLVKVTGRQSGAQHVQAHLDYISRKGKVELEGRDGEVIDERDDIADRSKEWTEMTPYWRKRTTVGSVSLVFSMPEGTDAEIVKASVRALARSEIGTTHDYVMALHTDTPRPHIHLAVCARGDDGERFDPRKKDLFHFRERFAQELRARGVEAEATPRRARAAGPKGRSMSLAKIRLRAKLGVGKAALSDVRLNQHAVLVATGQKALPEFIANAKTKWSQIKEVYESMAKDLASSSNAADRQLSMDVKAFLKNRETVTMGPELLAKMYSEKNEKAKNTKLEKGSHKKRQERTRTR